MYVQRVCACFKQILHSTPREITPGVNTRYKFKISLTTRLKTSSLTLSPVSLLMLLPNSTRVERNRFTL